MTPWHLLDDEERDDLLSWMRRCLHDDPRDNRIYTAAIAVLESAAPWPSEALVVEYDPGDGPTVYEIVDVDGTILTIECLAAAQCSIWQKILAAYPADCTPLTRAAAEFLEGLR